MLDQSVNEELTHTFSVSHLQRTRVMCDDAAYGCQVTVSCCLMHVPIDVIIVTLTLRHKQRSKSISFLLLR